MLQVAQVAKESRIARPATIYKAADIARARENLRRYGWAQRLLETMRVQVAHTLERLARDGAYLEAMIPATTPGGTGFTNCPACEGHAIHGAYHWDAREPETLTCTTCGLVYPNARYPEDVTFVAARHGGGQAITYHGGYAYEFRGYFLHSSWSAQIRARKVACMAGQVQTLATIYALTAEREYAERARQILLRFARVYPGYLVHSSYGEWIDLPPRLVAEQIDDLPEDEWTIPPNRPDRKLHSGYWNSGRATGSGMEGAFLRQLAIAYDLIYDTLGEDERRVIEQDLLLEGTVLLLADPAKNNKSVSNLCGAGLIGMAVGDPALVRAGADGFWYFVRRWFLPDGTTSESPAYGLMTLNGLWSFGEALHGYSDPPGYDAPDRWDGVDVYGDAGYRAVFRALYDTLLPDLRYPAFADSYVTTTLGAHYAELMAARYGLPEYRALLREVLGGPPAERGGEFALFHRDPDLGAAAPPADERVVFRSIFFPALRLAYLRTGEDGRRSTVILSASHWGTHHHRDSLNLILWQYGHEALTDLGYLWDRPDKHRTVRTAAHNLVVVDEQDQETTTRGGEMHRFDVTPQVQVVECSSQAYPQCRLYRRTCVLVDHGAAGSYLVDVFRVAGGTTHDYLFHGPISGEVIQGIALQPVETFDGRPLPYDLKAGRGGRQVVPWRVSWQLDEQTGFTAWAVSSQAEGLLVASGWGERGWGHFNTPDKKVDVPYILRRHQGGRDGELVSVFIAIYEVFRERPLVTGVQRLGVSSRLDKAGAPSNPLPVAIGVETPAGTDLVVSTLAAGRIVVQTRAGPVLATGPVSVISPAFEYRLGASAVDRA